MSRRRVAVLGSTGSIGTQALEIIDSSRELELHSILCYSNLDLLRKQRERYSPAVCASVMDVSGSPSWLSSGPSALGDSIHGADIVLNAIVGSAGLSASLLCMDSGILLALANKESLVVGGELLESFLRSGMVIPVDSEHSTIFRCLRGETVPVTGITLTASGGSVRDMSEKELMQAPVSSILSHPTWDMGRRITVDSATMVNKGFEVIEARWLFDISPVDVVIHPGSLVHSLVRLGDGSWKALMGLPDMRIPIQYALCYPDHCIKPLAADGPLDWGSIEFLPVDHSRYPAFDLVVQAGEAGGTMPAAVNAADEVAVEAFLAGRIRFGEIARVIARVMDAHETAAVSSLDDVMHADERARTHAGEVVKSLC